MKVKRKRINLNKEKNSYCPWVEGEQSSENLDLA